MAHVVVGILSNLPGELEYRLRPMNHPGGFCDTDRVPEAKLFQTRDEYLWGRVVELEAEAAKARALWIEEVQKYQTNEVAA